MRNKIVCSIVAVAALAGCATTAQVYMPVIDPKVGDQAAYPDALAECQSLAAQVDQGNRAAAGALAGALISGALGAMLGARGSTLAGIAGSGAVIGGANTAAYAGMTQAQIIQRCLTNRGYSVLG